MKKPMQFIRVSVDPTSSLGAVRAITVEYCGESSATVIPQTNIMERKKQGGDQATAAGNCKLDKGYSSAANPG